MKFGKAILMFFIGMLFALMGLVSASAYCYNGCGGGYYRPYNYYNAGYTTYHYYPSYHYVGWYAPVSYSYRYYPTYSYHHYYAPRHYWAWW
jgi:hypothetical protein